MESKELKDKILEQQALVKVQLKNVSGGDGPIIQPIQPGFHVNVMQCIKCRSNNTTLTQHGILCNDCGYLKPYHNSPKPSEEPPFVEKVEKPDPGEE